MGGNHSDEGCRYVRSSSASRAAMSHALSRAARRQEPGRRGGVALGRTGRAGDLGLTAAAAEEVRRVRAAAAAAAGAGGDAEEVEEERLARVAEGQPARLVR